MMNKWYHVLITILMAIQMTGIVDAASNITVALDACLSRYKDLLDQVAATGGAPEKCEYLSPVFTCQLGGQSPTRDDALIKAVKEGASRLVGRQGACDDTIDAIVDSAGDFHKLSPSQENSLHCWESFEVTVNYTGTDDVICESVRNFSKCIVKAYGSLRPSADVVKEAKAVMSDLGQRSSFLKCEVNIEAIMYEVWGNGAVIVNARVYVIAAILFSFRIFSI